jgi:drug/metabolite transporter (DMT)-like permease
MKTRGVARGEVAIMLAACGYGVSTSLSVRALQGVHPADLVAIELAGGTVLLFVLGYLRGVLTGAGAGRHLAAGSLLPGAAFILGDLGLARTSATAGSLMLSLEPLMSVVLAVVLLREAVSRTVGVALALGVTGSVAVAVGSPDHGAGRDPFLGNLLVVASVVAAATFLIATRSWNDGEGLNTSAWQTLGGTATAVPFVATSWAISGSRIPTADLATWTACLGVLLSTALAAIAFNWGIARVEAVRATQLLNLTPVIGVATAIVFLGERLVPFQLVGGLLVLSALALLVGSESDRNVLRVP